MEMREIEAFLAVAEEQHFGRAAELLRLTPSAVSQAVRSFERRVGGDVFTRTSRSVALTPLGERLRAELGPAHARIRAAVRAARHSTQPPAGGPLRVGLSTSFTERFRDEVLEAFASDSPGCTVVRYDLPAADLVTSLVSGRLLADVQLLWLPGAEVPEFSADVVVGPVVRLEERALMMAPSHPLATRESVDAEELAEHVVRLPVGFPPRFVDGWTPPVTPGGLPVTRKEGLATIYLEGMPAALAGGELVHVSVASLAGQPHPGLVVVPLTGLPPMPVRAVWSSRNDNPWIARFVTSAARIGARGTAGP